jgi:hypothetical protein
MDSDNQQDDYKRSLEKLFDCFNDPVFYHIKLNPVFPSEARLKVDA